MKKTIERTENVLEGVSTLDTILRNTRIILLLLIAMTALGGAVRGGHSTLDYVDPSFNPQIQTSRQDCKSVSKIIPLPDDKTLVSGHFNTYNRQPADRLARLNADGTLDMTFNSRLPFEDFQVNSVGIQADGKIVVFLSNWNEKLYQLIRLNTDGSVDPAFNSSSGWIDAFYSFVIDANDRIILFNGSGGIIRLNPDGSRDGTFQFSLNERVPAAWTQGNKIIISSPGLGWEPGVGIRRLNEDGTIDSSFMTRNIRPSSLIVQPDRKILITAALSQSSYILRRLNEDGNDDTGFTVTTFPFPLPEYPATVGMALLNNGKITLAAYTGNGGDYQIRRFLADGTADSSFTPYSAVRFNSLAVQVDGGVLVGDSGSCSDQSLTNDFLRLLPNGSPDPTFNTGMGFQSFYPGLVFTINVQADSKILIGGNFDFVNDVPQPNITRLNADSTLDTSFQISTGGTANYFSRISEFTNIRTQSDGKIVATGDFAYVVNGSTKSNLVRLNSDGSIDPTFILSVPIVSYFTNTNRIVTFNDGKLLIGTMRLELEQPPVPVKLLASGERDTTFDANLYPQQTDVAILDVAVQPDGRIILGGFHRTDPSGIEKGFLTRLNADGSVDTSFHSREQLNTFVRAFVLLPNGKIVVAESGNVLRLNSDGTVDPTFNAGTADGQVNAMLLLSTGRIFLGGNFSNFNGQPRGNLVQLNEDGSVFTPVYNLNGEVLSLAVDAGGRVFVGGAFTTVIAGSSGAERSYVAGLIDATASKTRFDFTGDGRADPAVYSGADGEWSILNRQNNQSVSTKFGLSEDKTVPADFDGDGKTDIAVFRPSDGTWYLLRSREGFGAVRWGAAEDKPMAGDFDGDGRADLAIWRPSSGVWWILKGSTGEAAAVNFGMTGDLPLSQADFDGDRKTDIAVWRPSNGNFYWLASGSGNRFNAVHFGQNGDVPAVADYNGDGKTDLVVFRPVDGNWHQYLSTPTGEYTYAVTSFGLSGDEPVAADYDGDGRADIAVRRGNVWHILNSTQGYAGQVFGNAHAQAVAALSSQ